MKNKLKNIRLDLQRTQPEMAKAIGCSHRQFRRYENGESAVPFVEGVLWAKALKINIKDFIKLYQEE